jgi:hypothetical protein
MQQNPPPTSKADVARAARAARQAAALRENLRRRKEQSRARTEATPESDIETKDFAPEPPLG